MSAVSAVITSSKDWPVPAWAVNVSDPMLTLYTLPTAKLAVSGIAQQTTFERGLYQHLDMTSPALTTRAEVARTATEYGERNYQARVSAIVSFMPWLQCRESHFS